MIVSTVLYKKGVACAFLVILLQICPCIAMDLVSVGQDNDQNNNVTTQASRPAWDASLPSSLIRPSVLESHLDERGVIVSSDNIARFVGPVVWRDYDGGRFALLGDTEESEVQTTGLKNDAASLAEYCMLCGVLLGKQFTSMVYAADHALEKQEITSKHQQAIEALQKAVAKAQNQSRQYYEMFNKQKKDHEDQSARLTVLQEQLTKVQESYEQQKRSHEQQKAALEKAKQETILETCAEIQMLSAQHKEALIQQHNDWQVQKETLQAEKQELEKVLRLKHEQQEQQKRDSQEKLKSLESELQETREQLAVNKERERESQQRIEEVLQKSRQVLDGQRTEGEKSDAAQEDIEQSHKRALQELQVARTEIKKRTEQCDRLQQEKQNIELQLQTLKNKSETAALQTMSSAVRPQQPVPVKQTPSPSSQKKPGKTKASFYWRSLLWNSGMLASGFGLGTFTLWLWTNRDSIFVPYIQYIASLRRA